MKINERIQPAWLIALIIIVLLVISRWMMNGSDFSSFFVAGSDFVDSTQTPAPIIVQPGQGYDGQFFYRLALDPFDFSQVKYGITIDFPSYRSQRIIYPFLAWIFSFGGIPVLVPWALVLVNVLAFTGIFFFLQKITIRLRSLPSLALYPLFIFGIYMSVAKDLSEVTELFFFTGTIWFMIRKSWVMFACFATLTLLTRETSMVALAPLAAWLFFTAGPSRWSRLFFLVIPFAIFILWKYYVNTVTHHEQIIEGTGNLSWPFSGIYPGFITNFNFSSMKNIMQFCFWAAYFLWQLWIILIVCTTCYKHFHHKNDVIKPLTVIYISWLLFAICLSPAVYVDDWSFVRVFGLWNMCGFLICIAADRRPGKWFLWFSVSLLILTVIRLIIKP